MTLTKTLGTAAVLLATSGLTVMAMTQDDVVKMLEAEGYTQIEVESEDGETEIEGISAKGEREITLDADGNIIEDETEFEDEDGNGIHDDFENGDEDDDADDEDEDDDEGEKSDG